MIAKNHNTSGGDCDVIVIVTMLVSVINNILFSVMRRPAARFR